ncbi:hypothetical protein EIP91_003131 [Steccherinum ochraceum]|uniref:Chromo domain-containing protein n=1 Tax=Steccherinum ochraceum TaxID=92696 RepID=A0A4R0S2I3_9APHY|nr:hypothetical protein EIP91_003131 [Steccherinum ochraceum]
MARRTDSDEEMAPPETVAEENVDDDADEEEYEIEVILEAKHGMFGNSNIGYLVKWKGYGPEDNSWVNEEDAQGAKDLIDEYWRNNKKNTQRKSSGPGPRKSLPSASRARDESPEIDAPSTQKRGRQSSAKAISVSDDDGDEEERPQPKKSKADTTSASARKSVAKSASTTKSASQKSKKSAQRTPEVEESEEEEFTDMRKWKTADTWEHIVERVETVERTDDGKLFVYFTLNSKGLAKTDNKRCREESKLCRLKFPQALLEFYERNLRWRKIDGDDEDD